MPEWNGLSTGTAEGQEITSNRPQNIFVRGDTVNTVTFEIAPHSGGGYSAFTEAGAIAGNGQIGGIYLSRGNYIRPIVDGTNVNIRMMDAVGD